METASITLKSGEVVKINDHVYCSPNWTVRDGTPYSIARVMEFLPPKGATSAREPVTRARLAWYYRPTDLNDRSTADSRMLYAAIYSEVLELTQIRSKCLVVHKDRITDLSGWKKRPDRFYFFRIFDPYIKRELELIQTTDVRNVPDNVKERLVEKYEFVAAEKEFVSVLTDNKRLCCTCSDWCSYAESVQCDRCKHYYHMHCVFPPLQAKPSRGYGWSCARCSKDHEDSVVDVANNRHGSPPGKKSNAPAVRGRGRPRKNLPLAEKEESTPLKHFRMWPFRYFGMYTVAEDVLDDEDTIYPHLPVRQGPRFQTTLPDIDSPAFDEERGGDITVETYSAISILTDAERAEVESCMSKLTDDAQVRSSVDWRTEVIHRYTDAALNAKPLSAVSMKSPTRQEQWKSQPTCQWTDRPWTQQEITAFEDAILTHGAEMRPICEEIGTRSVYEVVRFYGLWKSAKVGEENEKARRLRSASAKNGVSVSVAKSDDEGSVIEQPTSGRPLVCGSCRTRESKTWWKAPKNIHATALCENCGLNWRKYAELTNARPLREDSLARKREGTPLASASTKRTRTSNMSTPPPPAAVTNGHVPPVKCQACNKFSVLGKALKCKKCSFKVHAGFCGAIPDPSALEDWMCDICQNEDSLEASIQPRCVLCPRALGTPSSDSILRACKPTEGMLWTHTLCAIYSQEVTFTDWQKMKLVEGISGISQQRWKNQCSLCAHSDGAVVKCSDCPREFHVSCAWTHGYKFGFDILPVKGSRKDTTTTTVFNGDAGNMNPIIMCRDHDRHRRQIYDLCEMNEVGETAVQVYCKTYKQADVSQTHLLFRKAKRLDSLLNLNLKAEPAVDSETDDEDMKCFKCGTTFAPAWYPMDGNTWCHQCTRKATGGGLAGSESAVVA